jgi:hypothetical protein
VPHDQDVSTTRQRRDERVGETGGGGTGGNGSGGDPGVCDVSFGMTAAFTGTSSTKVFDDFETPWRNYTDNGTYTGEWYPVFDNDGDGNGSPNISPVENWVYDQDPCNESGALHITGTGYTTWGASFDAKLMLAVDATVNLSAFDGVGFWARSPAGNTIRLVVEDDTAQKTAPDKFVGVKWKQFLIPWPSGADSSAIEVVKFGVLANETIDVWIDDIVFYKAE